MGGKRPHQLIDFGTPGRVYPHTCREEICEVDFLLILGVLILLHVTMLNLATYRGAPEAK